MPARPCIFEYIYFSRPDSIVGGRSVYEVRKALGAQLARESQSMPTWWCRCRIPACRPRSATRGHSGVPFELGIIRNHYVGRPHPADPERARTRRAHEALANRAAIEGNRIVLIDDSLVRGTTSKKIVRMMRDAGAREVHFRIASPPIIHPDYYGIDLPDHGGAAGGDPLNRTDARHHRRGNPLAFLSIDGMYRAMGEPGRDPRRPKFSDHCFTGAYPTPPHRQHPGRSPSRGSYRYWRKRAEECVPAKAGTHNPLAVVVLNSH